MIQNGTGRGVESSLLVDSECGRSLSEIVKYLHLLKTV